jgi:hypothetical protein
VFAPTNLEVVDEVRNGVRVVLRRSSSTRRSSGHGNKAVVTEYAWQTSELRPVPRAAAASRATCYTLGADVLLGGPKPTDDGPMPGTRGRSAPPGGFFGGFSSWVLTRLHTRYDKTTLSEDITLVQAKPVVGGRAQWDGKALEGAGEVKMDSVNNFQGRYIIRHYWEGAVACQNPVYDRWGGPPGGDRPLQMATDLANAPRGQVTLKTAVRSSLPQLGLPGLPAPKRGK